MRRFTARPAPLALGACGAGLLLLVVVVVAIGSDRQPSVGGSTVARLASQTPAAGASVPVQSGALPAPAAVVVPTRITIPAIGVAATVRPTGVDPTTGDFSVPPSVDTVGWYRYGPGLDALAGSTVIAGHVDSAEQGRGAFFRLHDVAVGDAVDVTGADGRIRAYRVIAREDWPKSKIPLTQYFARDGAPRLTLITCGGQFDPTTHSYRDNIVITAVPLG